MQVKRQAKHQTGSVRFDKRRGTWNYLWYDGPTRRSKRVGTKQEYPTKAAAWKAVESENLKPVVRSGDSLGAVAEKYEAERMPERHSTARVYRSFLKHHILPKWADTPVRDVQPRPVELWLRELPLSPKTKTHIRSLMHSLVDFAMWAGMLELSRNPISLVRNQGATKRTRQPHSLSADQFRSLLFELREPVSTLALISVCLGLRVSEALALRWSDVDWLRSRLNVQRGIVNQLVADVKTTGSARVFNLTPEVLDRLRAHRRETDFTDDFDWIFASPVNLGRLPYAYTSVWREVRRAAKAAGLPPLGTHTFRHTYRSWLDAVGTGVAVQQKMMRHSDIRTTLNIYGDVVTDEMDVAAAKVSSLAFSSNGAHAERVIQ